MHLVFICSCVIIDPVVSLFAVSVFISICYDHLCVRCCITIIVLLVQCLFNILHSLEKCGHKLNCPAFVFCSFVGLFSQCNFKYLHIIKCIHKTTCSTLKLNKCQEPASLGLSMKETDPEKLISEGIFFFSTASSCGTGFSENRNCGTNRQGSAVDRGARSTSVFI